MAGIIKAGRLPQSTNGPGVPLHLGDIVGKMSDRANSYLDGVREQAAEIVAQAKQEADRIRRDAENFRRHAAEEGREQAEQIAREAADKAMRTALEDQVNSLVPALGQAIEGIRVARQTCLTHWEKNGVKLAGAIAERVIRRELKQQPEITLELLRESLELAAGIDQIVIGLHPDDIAALGDGVSRITSQFSSLSAAEVVADPDVSRGGCVVKTQFGVIDQQVESQLARIAEELTGDQA